eukprot:scaffold609216_cov38-Prasinocladus_malaysianus.AAC.1
MIVGLRLGDEVAVLCVRLYKACGALKSVRSWQIVERSSLRAISVVTAALSLAPWLLLRPR